MEEARGRSGDVKVKEEGERGGQESRAEEGERKMEESGKEEDMDMASVLLGRKVDFTGREGRAQGNNGIIMGGKGSVVRGRDHGNTVMARECPSETPPGC